MKPQAYQLCDLRDYQCQARASGLRYVSDGKPGITRRRHGKHFLFFDARGERILDENEIMRIRRLAIPPAYARVWICPDARGHIQATGLDARGRKQYRYHALWRELRDATKFNHILAFGEALAVIRSAAAGHMALRGLCREKVLATVVTLLEKTLIRVGNDEYARKNQSYGLTTLCPEHVEVSGSTLRFRFKGKSNKEWNLKISDRRIANIVESCAEIEGQELFKWVDEAGGVHDVTSGDVNAYLQEVTGEAFTAKDFRTWTGTVLAAAALCRLAGTGTAAQARKNIAAAISDVSQRLGNTPSVCRKCYVHPEIVAAYMDGSLIAGIAGEIDESLRATYQRLRDDEVRVLIFLRARLAKRGNVSA